MHIRDHARAEGWFRKHAAAPSSVGSWKAFVARNKRAQEPRTTAADGGLMEEYYGKDKLDWMENHKDQMSFEEYLRWKRSGSFSQGGRIGFYAGGTKLSKAKKKKLKVVKDFTAQAGPGTGKAVDNPTYYKKVKSALNKIKKQRNNRAIFEWSENSDWYKKLRKDLGGSGKGSKGLNRDYTNQLINNVIEENFPNAYHGKTAIKNFRNDMVVNSFVEHLKTVGEFDGYEKTAKILEQFEGVGDHRYENINRSWKSWIAGEFEVDGLDRAKLKKELKARGLSYDQIDNWSVSSAQKRGVNKVKELKWLDNQNIKHSGRSVDDVMKRFKEAFPDSDFYLRANELTSLKNTGKYISGSGSSRGIVGIETGNRSKWLKDGFGVQFKGNYSKMIKAADELERLGRPDEAIRLRKGANDFFGPDGLITKAKGEGEHALGRSFDMLNPEHQLKINSLVSGDINQFKKWNFDIPVKRYYDEYNKPGTTKARRKELAKLIDDRKRMMNALTGGGGKSAKGMVAEGTVSFRYGPDKITATSDVIPLDKLKNFDIEEFIAKGKGYEDKFLEVSKIGKIKYGDKISEGQMKGILQKFKDAGIPCIKGVGGDCTSIADYQKGYNKIVKEGAEGSAKAIHKLKGFTKGMRALTGAAKWTGYGLLAEAGFMVPFAIADYSTGESWKRILGNATDYGFGPILGQSEQEEFEAALPEGSLAVEGEKAIELGDRLTGMEEQTVNPGYGRIGYEKKAPIQRQKVYEDILGEFDFNLQPFLSDTPFAQDQWHQGMWDQAHEEAAATRAQIEKEKQRRIDERTERGIIADQNWQSQVSRAEGGIMNLKKKW